ncbi:MAG: hypothetical protein HY744_13565 [Deltaproteobacteria bacterium]|nr:hypothetical protein [Deltaproteobacteria bacterium]
MRSLWLTALVVVLALLAQPASGQDEPGAPGPDSEALARAKAHMAAGIAFLQDPEEPRYVAAYAEFRQAYELSGSYNALRNMGFCAQKLERDGEAIERYRLFLRGRSEEIDPETRGQIERDLAMLEGAVVWVTFWADRDDAKLTDVRIPARGLPITNDYGVSTAPRRIGLHPGQHTFTAAAAGLPDQIWKGRLTNGTSMTHAIRFAAAEPAGTSTTAGAQPPEPGPPPPAEPTPPVSAPPSTPLPAASRPPPTLPGAPAGVTRPAAPLPPPLHRPVPAGIWVGAALTAALAVPAGVFIWQSNDKKSEYDEANGRRPRSETEELRGEVIRTNVLADAFTLAAAVGFVTTTILLLARPEVPLDAAAARPAPASARGFSASLTAGPGAGPGASGAWLGGRF